MPSMSSEHGYHPIPIPSPMVSLGYCRQLVTHSLPTDATGDTIVRVIGELVVVVSVVVVGWRVVLVLKDGKDGSSESFLWQSFDYPCDTLLPGMKL
uniref:Bulb-type lectin domain-containing protein n=1 Tax=Nelumbo nucifera TaxID=4432 RepID=A0A822YA79_NELNU|nr:TPA_asm: hypothetical protein HUJ06_030948 [Nelumbo nucifera]